MRVRYFRTTLVCRLAYLDQSKWQLHSYGRYVGPISIFASMSRLFSHAQPIDFNVGYKWRTPNLVAAVNTTAPAEVATTEPAEVAVPTPQPRDIRQRAHDHRRRAWQRAPGSGAQPSRRQPPGASQAPGQDCAHAPTAICGPMAVLVAGLALRALLAFHQPLQSCRPDAARILGRPATVERTARAVECAATVDIKALNSDRADQPCSGRKKARMSSASSSGCSIAAKWPPRGITVQRRILV
jgi:hypothetical protein